MPPSDQDSRLQIQDSRSGFTFAELMIVIASLGILFAVVAYAIDPARRFAEARNRERHAEVQDVLTALVKYKAFNNGNVPATLDAVGGSSQVLGTNVSGCDATCTATATVAACLDLSAALVEQYLAEIPADPLTGTSGNSDYYVNRFPNGRIVVGACDPERFATTEVGR
jgi:Tfp pilus assembly protein PilE